jgi:hypothetical protein
VIVGTELPYNFLKMKENSKTMLKLSEKEGSRNDQDIKTTLKLQKSILKTYDILFLVFRMNYDFGMIINP